MVNDIGVCHFELRQFDDALRCFTEALSLDSKHAPSYSNRANGYRNKGMRAPRRALTRTVPHYTAPCVHSLSTQRPTDRCCALSTLNATLTTAQCALQRH